MAKSKVVLVLYRSRRVLDVFYYRHKSVKTFAVLWQEYGVSIIELNCWRE